MNLRPLVLAAACAIGATALTLYIHPATSAKPGSEPPASRFIPLADFNDQAVLDSETGLVWERAPGTDFENYSNSQMRCDLLNVGNGKYGWRMPKSHELMSLFDKSLPYPYMPADHPFTVGAGPYFWTSTKTGAKLVEEPFNTDLREVMSYRIVGLLDPYSTETMYLFTKLASNSSRTWCVRSDI